MILSKLMQPFDMSYDGFFKNNIENLYKYNYTEDDCKALCMTPLAKSEFRNCVISDDNFNPGDDEEIRKTFGITNDFTPEEEQQIIEENKWCMENL